MRAMPLYYFDVRNGDRLAIDQEGYMLPNIARVQYEAKRSLVDMGRDAVRSPTYDVSKIERLAIEVRNEAGPVLQVKLTFEVNTLAR
jgi:hypothetical protein